MVSRLIQAFPSPLPSFRVISEASASLGGRSSLTGQPSASKYFAQRLTVSAVSWVDLGEVSLVSEG
jgi:hypothetical protein